MLTSSKINTGTMVPVAVLNRGKKKNSSFPEIQLQEVLQTTRTSVKANFLDATEEKLVSAGADGKVPNSVISKNFIALNKYEL